MMFGHKRLLALALMALGGFAGPSAANEDESGHAWQALNAQWWQWVLSIPAPVNPVLDKTGEFCMVGQRGAVWFLAGAQDGLPTQRTCSVPEGVPIYFPVVNSVWVWTPTCGDPPMTIDQLRAATAAIINGSHDLSVLLDNQPVRDIRRVRSDVFYATLPAKDNYLGAPESCALNKPQSPSVDDGYYVKLRGLSAGQHHLSIRGTTGGGFSVDVFYTLNVVSLKLKD